MHINYSALLCDEFDSVSVHSEVINPSSMLQVKLHPRYLLQLLFYFFAVKPMETKTEVRRFAHFHRYVLLVRQVWKLRLLKRCRPRHYAATGWPGLVHCEPARPKREFLSGCYERSVDSFNCVVVFNLLFFFQDLIRVIVLLSQLGPWFENVHFFLLFVFLSHTCEHTLRLVRVHNGALLLFLGF